MELKQIFDLLNLRLRVVLENNALVVLNLDEAFPVLLEMPVIPQVLLSVISLNHLFSGPGKTNECCCLTLS